jgi:hypothetical protein
MVKRLRYSKIDLVERQGALMLVTFLDDEGNMYQWAPKWSEVEQVFLKQINVERFNKPESTFLNRFAKTTQSVVEGAQRIVSAHKLDGWFERYDDEKLVLRASDKVIHNCVPGFEVTLPFLDTWVGRYVEAFVVNDIAIRLRLYWTNENDEREFEEYPPKETEDIPF